MLNLGMCLNCFFILYKTVLLSQNLTVTFNIVFKGVLCCGIMSVVSCGGQSRQSRTHGTRGRAPGCGRVVVIVHGGVRAAAGRGRGRRAARTHLLAPFRPALLLARR